MQLYSWCLYFVVFIIIAFAIQSFGGINLIKLFSLKKGQSLQSVMEPDANVSLAALFLLLFVIIFIFACVSTVRSLRFRNIIAEFLINNNVSRPALEKEFARAEEIAQNYWLSPELTISCVGNKFVILRNKNLVWMYVESVSAGPRYGHIYYLNIVDKNKNNAARISFPGGRVPDELFPHYERICPHIANPTDPEAARLYELSFESRFLSYKYYPYLAQRQGQPDPLSPAMPQSDLSGYQNLAFDDNTGKYDNGIE